MADLFSAFTGARAGNVETMVASDMPRWSAHGAMFELRPYQQAALTALGDYWRDGGGNPLVVMATRVNALLVPLDAEPNAHRLEQEDLGVVDLLGNAGRYAEIL